MKGWFPEPTNASARRVATGRITMNVVEAGDGPAILFIHGLGWDHSLWNPTLERLSSRYRVIAPDTRGHGRSDAPDGPYDMTMLAHDYAALLDTLDLAEVCIVGLSQGGMIAQTLTLLRLDLVRSLALVSTSCQSHPSLRENMEARIAAMDEAGPETAAGLAADSIFSARWRLSNPELLKRFITWRTAMPVAPLNASTRALYDFDLSDDLTRISVPTIVIAGEADTLTPPKGMEDIASLIPKAILHRIPGSGHMIPVEQAESLAALLDPFLDQTTRS